MKRSITYLLWLPLLVLFSRCNKSVTPGELAVWVKAPENGMVQEKSLGNFTYTVMYKPASYVALQSLAGEQGVNKARYEEELKAVGSMLYFTFQVAHADAQDAFMADVENEQEYGARVSYFMNDAQQDFMLVNGTDTLPCTLYHYERDYGISNKESISLGFDPGNKPVKNLQFIYNDQQLGTGPVKVTYTEAQLHAIPNPEFK